MGFFPTLAAIYVAFAFAFQAVAVGFISFDNRCASKRILWAIVAVLTGPVGLVVYLIKGRQRQA